MTSTEISQFTTYECVNSADLDPWMVRDEGFRRQAAAVKKIERLQRQLAKAQLELTESQKIITAGLRELARMD
jgi:hypothetical protein